MGLLFKHGTVINAADSYKADVLVEGEKIVLIGQSLPEQGHRVIDATNRYLIPGGIDVHTHLDLPFGGTVSSDDFNTGHRAAAFGGTTTHIDFAVQPKGGSLHAGLDTWHKKAAGKAQIDYSFHMIITDARPDVMAEIPTLLADGVTTLKLFTAYKGVYQVDDRTLFKVMLTAAENGMLVMLHAENGDAIDELTQRYVEAGQTKPIYHAYSRPSTLEGEATGRVVALAGVAKCPLYVVHMTCEESVRQLRIGRESGFPVQGETCVQYLFFTKDDLARPNFEGAKFVCSPPIRTVRDQEVLWGALRDGTLQVISTDHCPFFFEGGTNGRPPGKELGKGSFTKIPNGLPVIEDRMKVIWHYGVNGGRLSANRFVEVMCTNPAKQFGLYPRKGVIAVGSDADIVVWDPNHKEVISAKTHHMNVDYNLFEGREITGGVSSVFLRGAQIVDGSQWLGRNGQGQFLKRTPNAAIL